MMAGLVWGAVVVAPGMAAAQERFGDGAMGAVAGAVVGGPIGAAVGGIVGYFHGPAIAAGLGLKHHRRYRIRRYAR
jgi:hypothetical protein